MESHASPSAPWVSSATTVNAPNAILHAANVMPSPTANSAQLDTFKTDFVLHNAPADTTVMSATSALLVLLPVLHASVPSSTNAHHAKMDTTSLIRPLVNQDVMLASTSATDTVSHAQQDATNALIIALASTVQLDSFKEEAVSANVIQIDSLPMDNVNCVTALAPPAKTEPAQPAQAAQQDSSSTEPLNVSEPALLLSMP
jgi:hypothetical protein